MQRKHFLRAIKLADRCEGEDERPHPKVAAVIVKNGRAILEAFRGEIGKGDHAEYIALERKGKDNVEVKGADLITTLEPCTTRSHDKRPCVSWIKSRGIRKVWIATLDPNPGIRGKGEFMLQEDGILIGRFPDDVAKKVQVQNSSFFKYIISVTTRKSDFGKELMIIQKYVESTIKELSNFSYLSDNSRLYLEDLININARILTLDINETGEWFELGILLLECGEPALADRAFNVSTIISPNIIYGWIGRGFAQIAIYNHQDESRKVLFGLLIKAEKYLKHAYSLNSNPDEWHAKAWYTLADAWYSRGKEEDMKRCVRIYNKLKKTPEQ